MGRDRDFIRTYAEYNGYLKGLSCDYCGRNLLSNESAKYHQDYGRICIDCVDIVRSELLTWRRDNDK